MQKYKYTAVNASDKKFKGYYVANNPDDLRRQLANSGLFLVKYSLAEEAGWGKAISLSNKLPLKDLSVFCRQFSIMISAGIPIVECINTLKEQKYKALTKQSLAKVYDDLNSGMLLSEAMKKQKNAYPNFFVSMIYVGENSGSLDIILKHLATYYENQIETKKKLISAMIYPMILLVLSLLLVGLMTFYVIPKFMESFKDIDIQMPALTMALFNISNWLIDHILMIVIIIVSIFIVLFVFGRFELGKYVYDSIKYNFFLTRNLYMNMTTAKFARSLGLLLTGGTNMMSSLLMIRNILGNKFAEKRFDQVIKDIENGVNITEALRRSKLFRNMLIQMVDIGEKTGALDEVLMRSSDFFDMEVQEAIKKVTSMIQPIILIFMGGSVGLMFLAIYSPILKMITTLA